MSDLFKDVWQDLRHKRLWPLAVVLLLALVAIPALLTQSAAQQPPLTSPIAEVSSEDARVAVDLDGGDAASTGTGSTLDKFPAGNPFSPPSGVSKDGAGDATAATASAAGPSSGDAPSGGGGTPPPSDGDPGVAPPPVTRTETTAYEYVADVTFWTGARRRNVRGLRKLDMLPNQSAPVLIFMGTSGEGGNAVFLVDSTLEAAGEGRCVPSPANCAYVHVGPGAEHAFTTEEGDSYRLRVEEIRRVKVKASTSAAKPTARTSVGDAAAVRRFELPSLVDLVAVNTTETTVAASPSSTTTDGR